ncbi:MAG: T9SS type A sorting domain-containing protein [Paludibacteraceae bacterium]|nr:T9SS type A sorting domain-containing protein [Paludibacteraceae bacterium]
MKKVFLLFAAMSLCMSAFPQVYIIKDGKLQNGVSCGKEDCKNGDALDVVPASTLTETGEGYMTFSRAGQYVGCRLDLDPSVFNLHLKGMNIVFEYEMPHSAMLYSEELAGQELVTAEKMDKPTFNIICGTEVGNDFKFKFENVKTAIHICHHYVDGKYNREAEKSFVKYESYSFPKNDDKVNSIYLTYLRELVDEVNDKLEPAKIKNLYFYMPENFQTFFGESFDNTDNWQEIPTFMKSDTVGNPKIFAPFVEGCFTEGNHYYTVYNYDEVGKRTGKKQSYVMYGMMLYENNPDNWSPDNWTGSDGSGYLPSQLFHGMVVRNGSEDFNPVPAGSYVGLENVELPEKLEGDQLRVSCLTKSIYKSYSGDFEEGNELPIYYKFDNQTEESKLFPDTMLHCIYTKNENTLTIPSGAKSISFFFKQSEAAAYVVDNLELAANWTTSVADVNGESKTLTVYPNPVQDEIAFSGIDDIETVEIVSLTGAKISCPVVDGKVNVAKLAAGEYVIVVNKTISGKFIKK